MLFEKLKAGDPHTGLMFLFGLSGILTFPLLFFVSAPYGKLYREARDQRAVRVSHVNALQISSGLPNANSSHGVRRLFH